MLHITHTYMYMYVLHIPGLQLCVPESQLPAQPRSIPARWRLRDSQQLTPGENSQPQSQAKPTQFYSPLNWVVCTCIHVHIEDCNKIVLITTLTWIYQLCIKAFKWNFSKTCTVVSQASHTFPVWGKKNGGGRGGKTPSGSLSLPSVYCYHLITNSRQKRCQYFPQ